MAHHLEQSGGPRAVQELRAHGDAARIGAGKLVDGHPHEVRHSVALEPTGVISSEEARR